MMGRILLAGMSAGVAGVFTSWLITGVLFHPFQRRTPDTWRAGEGAAHYAAASTLTVISALVVSAFFAATGGLHVGAIPTGVVNGLVFGVLCWAAMAAPVLLSVGVFVNVHRGVVLGLVMDWLVVSLLAGGMAGWLLTRSPQYRGGVPARREIASAALGLVTPHSLARRA